MGSGSDLNAVLVPVYLLKSASSALRMLSDVCGRRDLRGVIGNARRLADSFDRMPGEQTAPYGEHVVAKGPITTVPARTWRQVDREEEFRRVFEEVILPAFQREDEIKRGRSGFTVILTATE